MSNAIKGRYRQTLLSHAQGNILEIGFGTGLNLPYYPPAVDKLTVIEPNVGMSALGHRRNTFPVPLTTPIRVLPKKASSCLR